MERGIILVEYIPDFCCVCDYASNEICRINERDIDVDPYTDRPEWCPIKEIPTRLEELKCPHSMSDCQRKGFSRGWNACIDEIEGTI